MIYLDDYIHLRLQPPFFYSIIWRADPEGGEATWSTSFLYCHKGWREITIVNQWWWIATSYKWLKTQHAQNRHKVISIIITGLMMWKANRPLRNLTHDLALHSGSSSLFEVDRQTGSTNLQAIYICFVVCSFCMSVLPCHSKAHKLLDSPSCLTDTSPGSVSYTVQGPCTLFYISNHPSKSIAV